MKKVMILFGRYMLIAASVLIVIAGLTFFAPDTDVGYLIGASLFPAAVAWFALKRSRAKRSAPALAESAISLLSIGMWLVSLAAIISGKAALEVLGASEDALTHSTGWLSVFGGLCSYWFGGWIAGVIDRKASRATS